MTDPIIILISLATGGAIAYFFLKSRTQISTQQEATLLLESIRTVCKLVTVESDMTEILNHKEKKSLLFRLIPQNKQILLIVKAKAMVGFDLTKASFHLDTTNRRLIFANLPRPEVLSMETDITYYDIQQSTFNKFSPADYTDLNQQAKTKIMNYFENSQLPGIAEQQGKEIIKIIRTMTEAAGWHLDIPGNRDEPKQIGISNPPELTKTASSDDIRQSSGTSLEK